MFYLYEEATGIQESFNTFEEAEKCMYDWAFEGMNEAAGFYPVSHEDSPDTEEYFTAREYWERVRDGYESDLDCRNANVVTNAIIDGNETYYRIVESDTEDWMDDDDSIIDEREFAKEHFIYAYLNQNRG